MTTQHIRFPDDGILTVPTVADLPPVAADGTPAIVTGTDSFYIFDFPTLTWLLVGTGGGGAVNSVNAGTNVQITGPLTDPIVSAGTQDWQFTGIITTPLLNNVINDWNPSGFSTATVIRVVGDLFDPPLFTGLQGGSGGRFIIIHNVSPDTSIYFSHDDPLSSAGNRFLSPRFVAPGTIWTLPSNGMAIFQYDENDISWRVIGNYIYDVTDNGTGVVSVTDDGQNGRIVNFNGVFVDGTTITGNGTAFDPLVGQPALDVLINNTIFVDEVYGDDGTAQPNSMLFKYQTVDAAIAAWTPGYGIHFFPGNYDMTVPMSVTDIARLYLERGSSLQTSTGSAAFLITPGQFFNIDGEGTLSLIASLFANQNPADTAVPQVHIKCGYIDSSGAGDIGDVSTMKWSIRAKRINERGIYAKGWTQGFVACDDWVMTSGNMIRLDNLEANNGQDLIDAYGPRLVTVKGDAAERCQFLNPSQLGNGIYTEACRMEKWKSLIYLNTDFRSKDGFFLNHGNGTIYHDGNLFHSKSDTAGNEVPWYYSDQDPEDQYKPKFIHVRGSHVSATDITFAGSQNNEIFTINNLCEIELNGKYQNSGENSGLGPWPIIYATNQSSQAGQTIVTLNGDFKSLGGDVSPIRFVDVVNDSHTFKWIVKNTAIQTRATYSIDTNIEMLIYVYHSLVMDKNYNPLISDGLSEDRTIVDENITVDVPEYGI